MRNALIGAIIVSMAAFTPLSALADREPTPDERARIESTLRAAGFVTWEEIELDDDVWEIDDARREDGEECDVDIDAQTYQIIDIDC